MKLIIFGLLFVTIPAKGALVDGDVKWGYVNVRPHAKMFWELLYADGGYPSYISKPMFIFLSGGPGVASTAVIEYLREWTKYGNVLLIDNPVGVGYSKVDDPSYYSTNDTQIGKDLVSLMKGFYKELPEFEPVPLIIVGVSYGGKMGAFFADLLQQEITAATIRSNLAGLCLLDAWVSPIDSVLSWAPYLYNLGALDKTGASLVAKSAQEVKKFVDSGDFLGAFSLWGQTQALIGRLTKNIDIYNILTKVHISEKLRVFKPETKSEIYNVKDHMNQEKPYIEFNEDVFQAMKGDFMKPCAEIVAKLLDEANIRITVVTGQLDLVVDTPGTLEWVDNLKWNGKSTWDSAPRLPLVTGGYVEGYVKRARNLDFYWVNRAGHFIIVDNSLAMGVILSEMVKNTM